MQKRFTIRLLNIGVLKVAVLGLGVSLLASCEIGHTQGRPVKTADPASATDPGLIGPRKALTFVGTKAGEGYFSADGNHMVFQSEREAGNPFYQIYSMNLKTGQTDRLSTGTGKTTCAWFHPSMTKALYSSTHLDPQFSSKVKSELESRKSTQKQKYSWSYDDTYDIFEVSLKTKKNKRLTREKGYDAEASYSPDGKLIAFASNRRGYTDKLTGDEQKLFEQDPSYMMDIFVMNSDGTNVRQLTQTRGYDGGPFFSADGTKITWRRFAPNGQTAEIMSMNIDGTDERQLTKIGAMSWAPYFHPSGDYVIFTTNVLGFENFELYIVDTKGEKAPVRVSYFPGFDGLPVFSPNGQQISWTHRNEKGESQIYLAPWDDQKARKLLGLPERPLSNLDLAGNFTDSDAQKIVAYLTQEKFAGRMTGSAVEKEYSENLGQIFKDMGYAPYFSNNYLQDFEFSSGVKLGAKNQLTLKSQDKSLNAKLNEDFTPLSFSSSGSFDESEIVFAGYGIVAPSNESQPAYDSYQNLNVSGKWVLAFRDIPEQVPNTRRIFLNTFSRPHHKALVARERGAKGLLLVNGPQSGSKKKLMALRFEGAGFSGSALPVISISDEFAEKLVAVTGKSLKTWQTELDAKEIAPDITAQLPQGLLKGQRLQADIELSHEKAKGSNVIAIHRVPGAKGSVIIGAHGDHLGLGIEGNSLARGADQGRIHYGADDNASGVAALIQAANHIMSEIKSGRLKPKQNLVFAIWSGEEIGLLGSSHFVRTAKPTNSVYLNLDMVGRLRENLVLQGTGSAKEWPQIIERWAVRTEIPLTPVSDPFVPSDAMAFYVAGVPSLHFFTGAHGEYHTPQDLPSTLNYPGISKIAQMVAGLGAEFAAAPKTPLTYVKVESTQKTMGGRSFRIFLGTIPDYSQEGVKGVRITGTSKNSPAEKTGLKAGDIITELGGLKIENLYDYVYALQALKPNERVNLQVKRGEKVETLQITPSLKE